MSGFSAGANCFLSSQYKDKIFGPNPTTTRGATTHINAHPTENKIIYPSGKFIVIKCLDDPSNTFVYRGHAHPTTVAKFSPNGYWIASGDSSGKVRVWSYDNPEHLLKVEVPVIAGSILDLDWDPESKKIVAVGEGSGMMAKCFTWDTGNSVGEMVGHNKRVLSCAYKPSRPFKIITSSEDMKTIFYAGPPFKLAHSNPTHSNFVNCVRYSRDGSSIASVGTDKKIVLYDGTTGEPKGEIPDAHAGGIYSVSFSPDGSKLATASADKTVKIWDTASLALEQTISVSAEPQTGDMQVGVLWTNHALISLSLNGVLNLLDPAVAEGPVGTVHAHQVALTAMAFDPASEVLYSGSYDGVVCRRSLESGETVKLVGQDKRNIAGGAHGGKVSGIANVGTEIVSVGWDDTIRFADLTTGVYSDSSATIGQPVAVAASSTGLVAVVTTAEIALYRGHDKVGSLGGLSYTGVSVAILGDEELAVGGDDSKTHIYTIADAGASLAESATVETRSPVTALSYSPAGDVLAIGDNGRQVEVYERGSWAVRIKGKWVFHTSKITALAWSPSGSYLASGSLDESIIVWNFAAPEKKLQIPFAHMTGVSGLSWTAEGQLVSVGGDHTVVTWRVPSE